MSQSRFLSCMPINHHALDRIEGGNYELCETFGKEMPRLRLKAKPSVSLYLPCQEAHESGA